MHRKSSSVLKVVKLEYCECCLFSVGCKDIFFSGGNLVKKGVHCGWIQGGYFFFLLLSLEVGRDATRVTEDANGVQKGRLTSEWKITQF